MARRNQARTHSRRTGWNKKGSFFSSRNSVVFYC